MNQLLLDEAPIGDILQQVDDVAGPSIEKAIQKFLPRDIARKIRREAIEFIGREIKPPQPAEADKIVTMCAHIDIDKCIFEQFSEKNIL